jgi:hypothetical protein
MLPSFWFRLGRLRLLLKQALSASEPKVLDAAADEDTTDRFPKTADGRPRLSS